MTPLVSKMYPYGRFSQVAMTAKASPDLAERAVRSSDATEMLRPSASPASLQQVSSKSRKANA